MKDKLLLELKNVFFKPISQNSTIIEKRKSNKDLLRKEITEPDKQHDWINSLNKIEHSVCQLEGLEDEGENISVFKENRKINEEDFVCNKCDKQLIRYRFVNVVMSNFSNKFQIDFNFDFFMYQEDLS